MKKRFIMVILIIICMSGCTGQSIDDPNSAESSAASTIGQGASDETDSPSDTEIGLQNSTQNDLINQEPEEFPVRPSDNTSEPPGILPDLEYRAGQVSADFLQTVRSMDEESFWEATENETSFDGYKLYYVNAAMEGPAKIVVEDTGGSKKTIFTCNQPINNVYWLDRCTLIIEISSAIFFGDIALEYYFMNMDSADFSYAELDYPSQEQTKSTFDTPNISELLDYNVWHRGKRFFFSLSPEPQGPERKDVYVENKNHNFVLIAKDTWTWMFYGDRLYYRIDDSGNVYSVDFEGGNMTVAYTTDNSYGLLELDEIKEYMSNR